MLLRRTEDPGGLAKTGFNFPCPGHTTNLSPLLSFDYRAWILPGSIASAFLISYGFSIGR
ncbi:hypothetical protein M405DRAFT_884758 [Rhizopogon salebrosus TDB-379]|nr:hypothetical protein M405DRAFT_884758 [Rhizopogon salebrosus TDB-379]